MKILKYTLLCIAFFAINNSNCRGGGTAPAYTGGGEAPSNQVPLNAVIETRRKNTQAVTKQNDKPAFALEYTTNTNELLKARNLSKSVGQFMYKMAFYNNFPFSANDAENVTYIKNLNTAIDAGTKNLPE
jgi:hypothetical protein